MSKIMQQMKHDNINMEKQIALKAMRREIERYGIILNFAPNRNREEYDDSDSKDNEDIDLIFNNVRWWFIKNWGRKSMFEKMMKHTNKLERVDIRFPLGFDRSIHFEDDPLKKERDNRLYAVAIGKAKMCTFQFDNELLQDFISNSHPYQLWNKFCNQLEKNSKLESLYLYTIKTQWITNPLGIKKLCNIMKCLTKSNTKLKQLKFLFDALGKDEKLEDVLEDAVSLKSLLTSSILECIKSKAEHLEDLNLSGIASFDSGGKLATQLMNEVQFPNLKTLNLHGPEMNYQGLQALHTLLSSSTTLQMFAAYRHNWQKALSISAGQYNEDTDLKLAQSVLKNMTLSPYLTEIKFPHFRGDSIEYCSHSLAKLIRASTSNITIQCDVIYGASLRRLAVAYMERLCELYRDYKEIRDYIRNKEASNLLTGCDWPTRRLILEYCQIKEFKLNINIHKDSPFKATIGKKNSEQQLATLYPASHAVTEMMLDCIDSNDLMNGIEYKNVHRKPRGPTMKEYHLVFSEEMDDILGYHVTQLEFCRVKVIDDGTEKGRLAKRKDAYYSKPGLVNFHAICHRFAGDIAAKIEESVWNIIYRYYPQYNVYLVKLNRDVKIQKSPRFSRECDDPYSIIPGFEGVFKKSLLWKSMKNKYYNIDYRDFMDSKADAANIKNFDDVHYIKFDKLKIMADNYKSKENFQKIVANGASKGITLTPDSKISILRKVYMHSPGKNRYLPGENERILFCMDNDDVIIFENDEVTPIKYAFPRNTFLITDDNGDHIKDIATSKGGHILFLTQKGNLFVFGKNDYGNCGLPQYHARDVVPQIDGYKWDHGGNSYSGKYNAITIPYQLTLGDLSNKFITNIWVGEKFSLCMDKDKNVYCWGENEYNLMCLDRNKYQKDRIWTPVLHTLFNNGDNGKIIHDIKCGQDFVCFIDHEYQCYWSPNKDDGNKMNHFQSIKNKQFQDVKITNAVFNTEKAFSLGRNKALWLFDEDKKMLYYYMSDGTISEVCDLTKDGVIDKDAKIVNIVFVSRPIIFVENTLCL